MLFLKIKNRTQPAMSKNKLKATKINLFSFFSASRIRFILNKMKQHKTIICLFFEIKINKMLTFRTNCFYLAISYL